MRLRIIDWNTRWFWFVCFFNKKLSEGVGKHFEAHIYESQKWSGSWFNFWVWEEMPDMRPKMAVEPDRISA